MTANPSMNPKKTATTALLAGIGTAALAYALHLLVQPVTGTGWRHEASVLAPAAMIAPVQTRGSNSDVPAVAGFGETSLARGRN